MVPSADESPRTVGDARSSISSAWSALALRVINEDAQLTGRPIDAQALILATARSDLDRLYRLAGLILGDATDAEDATQEALLRAWKSAGSLRDPEQARAWLDRIVVNVCRDRLRRIRKVRFIALPNDAGATPLDPFQAVLQRDEAVRAIGYLDADQRIVVVLHYWAGLTLTEIADRLQWPVGTVKSRLHNALERMRARVAAPPFPIEASR